MARKRFTAEQIILKLREAEVSLAQGKAVGKVCKQMGVTVQTDYRWRKEYGVLKRITAMLRGEGWKINHKRVERLWRQEGLKGPGGGRPGSRDR